MTILYILAMIPMTLIMIGKLIQEPAWQWVTEVIIIIGFIWGLLGLLGGL